MFFLIAIFFGIFYFMIIRPQQKQQKTLQAFLDGLKKGDEVVTTGGLIGKIEKVADGVLTLEIASKVMVRVMKSQVTAPFVQPAEKTEAKPEAAEKSDAKSDTKK